MNFVYSLCHNANKIQGHLEKSGLLFLRSSIIIPDRNTFILKRKHPPGLARKGRQVPIFFKKRHHIYDLEENTSTRKKIPLNLILNTFVEGVGQKGELVQVKPHFGYYQLLLQGLAEYASPENLKKMNLAEKDSKPEMLFSSHHVPVTMGCLECQMLNVVMNLQTPWTLETWHIRTAFRKAGFQMDDTCIELPKEKLLGPNLELENKIFFVTVTINNQEKVKVVCRLHHWSSIANDRLPFVEEFWKLPPEAVFPDEANEVKEFVAAMSVPVK